MAGTRRRIGALAVAGALVLLATACEPWDAVPVSGFTPVAHHDRDSYTQDQGPATVYRTSVSTGKPYRTIVYGGEDVAKRFVDAGWTHLGDPDSHAGYIVWPYQASDASKGKMYAVVTPHGRSFEYVHPLDPGEELNNSFASVSPDGKWLVSGEWDTQGRLLVFPMPILNASVPIGGGSLPSAGTIELSTPLDQVQGCDFQTATRLICSVDDAAKRLVTVDLAAPLSGVDVTGTVTEIGKLPQVSPCTGAYETEGVDYDPITKLLRVEVIRPGSCIYKTDEYVYRLEP